MIASIVDTIVRERPPSSGHDLVGFRVDADHFFSEHASFATVEVAADSEPVSLVDSAARRRRTPNKEELSMSGETIATIGFLVLAMIEVFNGIGLAFRTRRTLKSAGLVHTDGPGLLIQEFGVYSLGIAGAYIVAAFDPSRFGGVGVVGIAINVCAAAMHSLRSVGIYFGDARPILSRAFERHAGLVHAFALLVLLGSQYQWGSMA